jgi:hypothetical protein
MAIALTTTRARRCHISPFNSVLLERAAWIAETFGRPVRPLQLQALLQMPRIADEAGLVPLPACEALLAELAKELPCSAEWSVTRPDLLLRSLRFNEIGEVEAKDVMQRFHYLRSSRTDGRVYGLRTPTGSLVAICVSSALDVPFLCELLEAQGRSAQRARVVSRVFAFEGAPENTISYLLSRAGRAECRLGVSDLVTYVNPNMGFTGISYRASAWRLLGHEAGTSYRYLDNRYVTDRVLASEFGRHEDQIYRRMLGERFAVSKMHLAPLVVFHRCLF